MSNRNHDQQWALAHPHYTDSDDGTDGVTWRIDFTTMKAEAQRFGIGRPDATRNYQLQRVSSSSWEMKLEFDSWTKEVAELRNWVKESPSSTTFRRELELLKEGPVWQTFRGCEHAEIERDYQMFVAQYHG